MLIWYCKISTFLKICCLNEVDSLLEQWIYFMLNLQRVPHSHKMLESISTAGGNLMKTPPPPCCPLSASLRTTGLLGILTGRLVAEAWGLSGRRDLAGKKLRPFLQGFHRGWNALRAPEEAQVAGARVHFANVSRDETSAEVVGVVALVSVDGEVAAGVVRRLDPDLNRRRSCQLGASDTGRRGERGRHK